MSAKLRLMKDALGRADTIPTLHVTASALEAHPEFSKELEECDVGIHGYRHVGYSALSHLEQESDLERAREVFIRHGLPIRGFRAPYLRSDEFTLDLLRRKGFAYDSSVPTLDIERSNPFYARVAKAVTMRYGLVQTFSTNESTHDGIVELPVSLPDDEILIDAMRIRNAESLTRVFNDLLTRAAGSRKLLVLQIHPERFRLVSAALRTVLANALDLGGWIAPLSDIALWLSRHPGDPVSWPNGHPFAVSISGDVDAVSLGDFLGRVRGASGWTF